MKHKHFTHMRLDPRDPVDRLELAMSHGWPAAWRAAIARYEAELADPDTHPARRKAVEGLLRAARNELRYAEANDG